MKDNLSALAIDIGGSKLMVGLVLRDGTLVARRRHLWTENTAEGVWKTIHSAASDLLAEYPQVSPGVIGAAIPGLADREAGLWVEATFSGIHSLPIASMLRDAFSLPAFIDNDGQASALAERYFGACRETDDFLYLTVSNGIGGALFLNGSLYYGAAGNAGEIGHTRVAPEGRPCGCGNRGCLEQHAAGPGIARNYAEITGIPLTPACDAREVARRARAGEAAALEAYALEGRYLGQALAAACNLLNPASVVIGGGVSLAFDLFAPALLETLNAQVYRSANAKLKVLPTPLGYDGALLGAAATAFHQLKGD